MLFKRKSATTIYIIYFKQDLSITLTYQVPLPFYNIILIIFLSSQLQEEFTKSAERLKPKHVGRQQQALAFVKLLPLARLTKQEQFAELLEAQTDLASPLVDLLGAVQTFDAHNATFAHFYKGADTAQESLELLEKYLQSLAVATHPDRTIVEHLYGWLQQAGNQVKKLTKLRDSVIQTLATLSRQSGFDVSDTLGQQIREYLLEGLKKPKEANVYIRALQNLRDPLTIDALLEQANQSDDATLSVAALQALKSFPAQSYAESHRQQFESIFYQRRKRFDSSARTLALDVLLAMRPRAEQLGELLDYLASTDRQFEIKTYVLQKLRMLAGICPRFRKIFTTELQQRSHVNNYNVLGQRGGWDFKQNIFR